MEWDVPSRGERILMITEPDVLLIWVDGLLLVDRRVRPSSFTSFARRFVYNSDSSGSCPILFWKRKLTARAAATASGPLETDTDGHISRITFKAHWVTDNWRRQRHDRSIGRNGQKVLGILPWGHGDGRLLVIMDHFRPLDLLAAGGQTTVFENSPLLEPAQVFDGDFNNRMFKGDDYERAKCQPLWNGRLSVTCPGKKKTFILRLRLSLKRPTRWRLRLWLKAI